MEHKTWMQWAIELQSLAQAGLAYGKDSYDKERYIRIREISAEIISHMSDIPTDIYFVMKVAIKRRKLIQGRRFSRMERFCLCMKITVLGRFREAGAMWISRWLPM